MARAKALAKAMPIWPPGVLVEYRPALDEASAANHRGGWQDRKRLRRGPHARRDREVAAAIFGENPGDDDDF